MSTNQELADRVSGQNVPQRFLKLLKTNAATEVVRWKDEAGVWQRWTLAELAEVTARLATSLRDLGIEPGDRVVLMLKNRPEFHPLDLATMFLGATPVSIYNSSAPEQIDYLVNHCGAKMAIVEDGEFLAKFDAVSENLPTIERTVVVKADGVREDVVRYEDMVKSDPADLEELSSIAKSEDLATIIYTSGTTGDPKGVMLSHFNVCWSIESVNETMTSQLGLSEFAGMKHISYLPMAHVFERLFGHYFLLCLNTQVVCCPVPTEAAVYAAEVKPNIFVGVPRVWEKIYNGVNAALALDPERAKSFNEAVEAAGPIVAKMEAGTATKEEIETYEFLDAVAFSQVRPLIGLDECQLAVTGSAPIAPEILTWFRIIGVPLSEGYGMSETTSILNWAQQARAGYVGTPSTGIEVKLAEDGEILARGGCVFAGYLDNPELTAATMEGDFLKTGDIGVLEDDGFLKIVDRKREIIITAGGKNVSPANLELALKMIPLVGQACVVGEARPFVSSLVVLDPDAAGVWAIQHGLEGDAALPTQMANNPEVIAEIDAGLAEAMSKFNSAESVKKVKVLGEEWLPDTEVMTPSSKLKRRGVLSVFAKEIEELYA